MNPLSGSNPRIKRLRRLSGRRSSRVDEGMFVLEGPTLIREAAAAGVDLEGIYVDEGARDLVDEFASTAGLAVSTVSAGVLASVLSTTNPQPACAVAPMSLDVGLAELLDTAVAVGRPVLVLADVADPGNVGTMLRTAESSGCAGVVVAGAGVDIYNPKVVRGSAGALFRARVAVVDDVAEVLRACAERSVESVAAVARGGEGHLLSDLSGAIAIILGNEAHGLPEAIVGECDRMVTITMDGPTESLNVAMAATVLCFEAWRQRSRG